MYLILLPCFFHVYIVTFLAKLLILKVWTKAVELNCVLMLVRCRNLVQMEDCMSWNHVRAVVCSELFNHCQSHNLNDNGTVPGGTIGTVSRINLCSDRFYWKYTGWAKVWITPYCLPVSEKKWKIHLQYIAVYLKWGSYMFEFIIKCLWCKIRYLHKLCWKILKWQLWKIWLKGGILFEFIVQK